MAHVFKLNKESLKREFAAYVVIIISPQKKIILYVGKTGDNREGCNPMISRCGNHFSYNKIHSQIRNIIKNLGENHEGCEYTYAFDHFGKYTENKSNRKKLVDQINEMERWLNQEIQKITKEKNTNRCIVANPFKGDHVNKTNKQDREKFRTEENKRKIESIVNAVNREVKKFVLARKKE